MKKLQENKVLLKKYLLIITFNIIIYILTSFYLKTSDTQTLVMLFIILIGDLIIYNYKEKVVFKYYLDILSNIIVGFLLFIFIKDDYVYLITILSIFISNNIVFMRSRISDKFLKRSLQYLLIFLITLLCMFINVSVINLFS